MPVIVINGKNIELTIAELVEYEREVDRVTPPPPSLPQLEAKPPTLVVSPPKPQQAKPSKKKTPAKKTAKKKAPPVTTVERLQKHGYRSSAVIASTFSFVADELGVQLDNPSVYDLETPEGRTNWLLSQDADHVHQLNEWTRSSMRIRSVGPDYWQGSVLAALWGVNVYYGPEDAEQARQRTHGDEVSTAIYEANKPYRDAPPNKGGRRTLTMDAKSTIYHDVLRVLTDAISEKKK